MPTKIYKRKFGSDPEFFIYSTDYDNKSCIPPAALVEDFNYPVIGLTDNGKRILFELPQTRFIEDGAAVELNFKKPINSPTLFNKLLTSSLQSFYNVLYSKYRLHIDSSIISTPFDIVKYGINRGDEFKDCIRFGCDADYRPTFYEKFDKGCDIVDSSEHPFRYAGGHFHMQNMSKDSHVYIDQTETFPLVLDLFLGTSNVIFSRISSIRMQEKQRLKYFGFPGRYRIQHYSNGKNGIEYRPLSNFWLKQELYTEIIFAMGDICGRIIENRLTDDFVPFVLDRLDYFYNSLLNHDILACKTFLNSALMHCLDRNIINLDDLTKIRPIL